ncbi:MAG: hypothetical protein ACYDCN_01850 [Bacteroidia bacterium]
MNDTLKKYLTKDERELLDLIKWHRDMFATLSPSEQLNVLSSPNWLTQFPKFEESITKAAQNRKERYDETQVPVNCACETCGAFEHRAPMGEITGSNGWKHNQYFCSACQKPFVDYMPNNPKDKLSWVKNFVKKMPKYKDKILDESGKKYFEQLKKDVPAYEQAYLAEKQYQETIAQAEEKMGKISTGWRDQLLLVKVRYLTIGNSKMGSS